MSRWTEQFNAHAFQATWRALQTALEKVTVDDETIITSVSEIARLKKVASYLDEMIQSIDPELVPMTTWDSFHAQSTPCLQQINLYINNRNIGHITQANAHADNLLTYLRPYVVATGDVAQVFQTANKGYTKTIEDYTESFRNKSSQLVEEISEFSSQCKELHATIESIKLETDEYHDALFGKEAPEDGIKNQINVLVEELEDKHQNITEYYNETLVGDKSTPATKDLIEEAKVEILNDKSKINELLEEVSLEVKELDKFHTKIFGTPSVDGEVNDGLAHEIEVRGKALIDFEIKQSKRYNALNKQIEDLLPGATSAGLASAYFEMKESFSRPIKVASLVFYAAIGVLIVASLILSIDTISTSSVSFLKIGEWDGVLKSLVYKIPFYAPVLWLAFYASKRRSEYQRLQQEYAHKEALAKSYDNFKKQLEQLDADDIDTRKVFIMKAIDAIAYNASTTLDGKHGDKMPAIEVIENLLSDVLKLKSAVKPN